MCVLYLCSVISMNRKITGIILAGGQGRRMGSEKGLAPLAGRRLIHYPLQVFHELCDEILISSSSSAYDFLGYRVIRDLTAGQGPMVGILSCLLEASHETCLVAGCDMPFVNSGIFKHLIKIRGSAQICVPWHDGEHYEPMCGLYSREAAEAMKKHLEQVNNKLPDFFRTIPFTPAQIRNIQPPLPDHYFFNVNSPEDLKQAERLMNNNL